MSFLKNLIGSTPSKPDRHIYTYNVECDRCGEIIEGHVDLDNDLSLNDAGDGYLVRKMLMGGNRCFQQIEVTMQFTSSRVLADRFIHGGSFVE